MIREVASDCIQFNKMNINILGNTNEQKFHSYVQDNIIKRFIPKRIQRYTN